MTEQQRTEPQRLEINWVQASAGALAAVSSAVMLSTLGVAGTIIGAAVGSVLVTVANSVYAHYLAASKERVAVARLAAVDAAARVRSRAKATVPSRGPASDSPTWAQEPPTEEMGEVATRASRSPSWRELFRRLQWKRIAVVAAGVFVLAMGAILAFEAVSGHAVSSYTGGSDSNGPRTSFGGGSGPDTTEPTQSTPTQPADTPTESTPTETEPTPTEETTTVPPTTEPTDEPTTEPTTQPTTEPPPETAPAE